MKVLLEYIGIVVFIFVFLVGLIVVLPISATVEETVGLFLAALALSGGLLWIYDYLPETTDRGHQRPKPPSA